MKGIMVCPSFCRKVAIPTTRKGRKERGVHSRREKRGKSPLLLISAKRVREVARFTNNHPTEEREEDLP